MLQKKQSELVNTMVTDITRNNYIVQINDKHWPVTSTTEFDTEQRRHTVSNATEPQDSN